MAEKTTELETICTEYVTSVYEMFKASCDSVSVQIQDDRRIELHEKLKKELGFKMYDDREPRLNRILHSLNMHIGFPMNEYNTRFREVKDLDRYGKRLALVLINEFKQKGGKSHV